MEYDRRVLIIDGPEGGLQRLALELLGQNVGVHYANDPSEAQLLAQEERGHIGAVLFTPDDGLPPVPDLARRLSVLPASLIPTGARPADREIAAMAFHGVRWHLWDEPSDETIRFVLANVLSEHDPMELRFHQRVPTRLEASLEIGDQKGEVTIRDLCLGGACVLGRIVGEVGDRGQLCFSLNEDELSLPARIAWSVPGTTDEIGVAGVAFTEVDPAAGNAIDRHLEAIIAVQRVVAPEA